MPTWPIILLMALVGTPTADPAPASEASAPESEVPRVLILVPAVADQRVSDVVATVASNVSAEEVDLLTVETDGASTLGVRVPAAQDAAVEHDARAVLWLDLRNDDEYVVYLYVRDRSAVLRRRVPEAAESVQAAVEAMWLIVRSGALAVALGVDVEMEAVDVEAEVEATHDPEPTSPPAARLRGVSVQRPPDTLGLWISFGYLGGGLSPGVPWQSGGNLELSYAAHRIVKVGIGYGVLGGMPIRDPAEFRILRHELAAILAIGAGVHPRLRVEGRLLPAAELSQWRSPGSDSAGLRVVAKAAAELVFRVRLIPRLTFDLGAGAGVAFNDFDFIQCDDRAPSCAGEARRVVLSPWRIRPRARAGVSWVF